MNAKAATKEELTVLYEQDEVAWLEESVRLIQQGRFNDVDYYSLVDFLESMASSQRREVKSRLRTLMVHLLKWQVGAQFRSGRWEAAILHQRAELIDICASPTLRNHALEVIPQAYERAAKEAAAELELDDSRFPPSSPFSLEYLLSDQLPNNNKQR